MKVRAQVLGYLEKHPCVDCGEPDPIVLEFDHRDRKAKVKPVSRLLAGHYSWKSVLMEIEKCDIRCANCHRRKTYVELASWGKTRPS